MGGSDAECFGFLGVSIQVPFRYQGGRGICGDRFVVAQAVELMWISNCILAVSRL